MGGLANPGQLNWRDVTWCQLIDVNGNLRNTQHVPDDQVYGMQPQQQSIEYRYATALHWSLTQFTPATAT